MTADLDPARIGLSPADGAQLLVEHLAAIERPQVIEVGTLRSEAANPTHHTAWAPHGDWTRVDREDGTDVDLVADAHDLLFGQGGHRFQPPPLDVSATVHRGADGEPDGWAMTGFDAYVACSVWEHLERPWRAMEAAATVVRPGGLVYVQTHQTFPIHGYPSDFYRFSTGAMRVMMEDAGLEVLHTAYTYPCRIIPGPDVTRWNTAAEAFLNVEALGRRPGEG